MEYGAYNGANLSVAWVHASQYLNALDNYSGTAKMVKSIKSIQVGLSTYLL